MESQITSSELEANCRKLIGHRVRIVAKPGIVPCTSSLIEYVGELTSVSQADLNGWIELRVGSKRPGLCSHPEIGGLDVEPENPEPIIQAVQVHDDEFQALSSMCGAAQAAEAMGAERVNELAAELRLCKSALESERSARARAEDRAEGWWNQSCEAEELIDALRATIDAAKDEILRLQKFALRSPKTEVLSIKARPAQGCGASSLVFKVRITGANGTIAQGFFACEGNSQFARDLGWTGEVQIGDSTGVIHEIADPLECQGCRSPGACICDDPEIY